jgi:FkbM family methyltransferase
MKLSFTKKIRVQIEDIIVKKGDLRQISHIALTIINRRRIPLPSAIYRHYNTVSEISDDMGDEGFLLEYIIPEPGKCLVDVGASVGGWTFIVAKKGRVVYAFEPSPKAYQILRQNAAKYPNVHTFAYALGDRDRTGRIGVSAFGLSGEMDAENTNLHGGGTIDIPVHKLDSLCLSDVGVIKIDTEGYETPILQGAKLTIQKYKPCLIIEVHKGTGKASETFSQELQKIKSMLQDFNYSWKIHYRQSGLHDKQHHVIATPKN